MIVVKVRFEKDKGKLYEYLLINPKKCKIDKTKPLVWERGCGVRGKIIKTLYATEARVVDELPEIVTAQIVLLDNDNHITVEHIGGNKRLPKETEPEVKKTEEAPPVQKVVAFGELDEKARKMIEELSSLETQRRINKIVNRTLRDCGLR